MKIVKKPTTRSASPDLSNAETYAANAIAYCKRSGRENGSNPVITKGTSQWPLWMRYFEHIGHPHAKPNSFANSVGRLTVPANSPDEFEPGWLASEPPSVAIKAAPKKTVHANDHLSDAEKAAAKVRADDLVAKLKQEIASTALASEMKTTRRNYSEAAE